MHKDCTHARFYFDGRKCVFACDCGVEGKAADYYAAIGAWKRHKGAGVAAAIHAAA